MVARSTLPDLLPELPESNRAADRATRRIVTGPLGREIARFGTPLALGMALQTDGKIVVAGPTGDANGNIAVARYLAQ